MKVIEFFVKKQSSLEYRVHNSSREWHYYDGGGSIGFWSGIRSNIQLSVKLRLKFDYQITHQPT